MSSSISERIGVVATALNGSVKDVPRLARQAGFHGVVFDVWSPELSFPDLSGSGRRELSRLLAAQEQRLVALQMDLGAKGLTPGADVDRQIDRLDRALETAAALESPLLCVDLGALPNPIYAPKPPAAPVSQEQAGLIIVPTAPATSNDPASRSPVVLPDPAFVAQANAALAEIGSRADRYSVPLAFSSSLSSFAALAEALAIVKCSWFGIDLDPIAVLRDDWSRDEIFSAVGPLIRHVRARDAVVGEGRRIKPAAMGQGDVNWPGLLGLLDDAGYQGFLTADPLELSDRARSAAGLRKLPEEHCPVMRV